MRALDLARARSRPGRSADSLRSRPEQKPRPAPVRMATRPRGSSRNISHPRAQGRHHVEGDRVQPLGAVQREDVDLPVLADVDEQRGVGVPRSRRGGTRRSMSRRPPSIRSRTRRICHPRTAPASAARLYDRARRSLEEDHRAIRLCAAQPLGRRDPEDLLDLASRAEEAGFASVWVSHHILNAGMSASGWASSRTGTR